MLSWPFKNNTPRLFIVFYLLGTKNGSNTSGNRGKEPRPANRRGTLCPGASGPTVRRRIAGPRSTPVKTPLPVLLWGPIEWCPVTKEALQERHTLVWSLVTLQKLTWMRKPWQGDQSLLRIKTSTASTRLLRKPREITQGCYNTEGTAETMSESIGVKLSPSYTIEMRSCLVGRERSAQMWKKSSGESPDAVTKDIFDTVKLYTSDRCWHLAWLLDLVGWPPMLWEAWMTVVATTYSCWWLK